MRPSFSMSHSNKFFHKKTYTVRQRKYCDKLPENSKAVFVLQHQHGWLILFQHLQNCVGRMAYIVYDIFSNFYQTCWSELYSASLAKYVNVNSVLDQMNYKLH